MAEGLLLVLVGDENKKRASYLCLPKRYEAEVLLGIETDTYDVLGKIIPPIEDGIPGPSWDELERAVHSFIGKSEQQYPAYSSKAVKGKPLFMWAREGRLAEIERPVREISIDAIEIVEYRRIASKQLLSEIEQKIALVKGDFRQQEILSLWREKLQKTDQEWTIIKIALSCSSGAYVRGLIHELGMRVKTGALALSIKRTKIGHFTSKNILNLK
jgi:tRNA pseudouridine55 synthase